MTRWIRFFIVLILGFGIGLFYGWVVDPVEYTDSSTDALRIDYKTDYILMVAETFQADNNTQLAVERLTFFGFTSPERLIEDAMDFGIQAGYAPSDLRLLRNLGDSLQVQWSQENDTRP